MLPPTLEVFVPSTRGDIGTANVGAPLGLNKTAGYGLEPTERVWLFLDLETDVSALPPLIRVLSS